MLILILRQLFRHGARTCSKLEVVALPEHVDQSLHDTYGYEQLTNVIMFLTFFFHILHRKKKIAYNCHHLETQNCYLISL